MSIPGPIPGLLSGIDEGGNLIPKLIPKNILSQDALIEENRVVTALEKVKRRKNIGYIILYILLFIILCIVLFILYKFIGLKLL